MIVEVALMNFGVISLFCCTVELVLDVVYDLFEIQHFITSMLLILKYFVDYTFILLSLCEFKLFL